ncbi:hypothetical protein HH214_15730 [Mucilaginibacter robiniae]|uniref:Lipoprotein n=1 Tax=Mucilaginibacter robiniae TaxID=2728022 RepID=A0A7L5E221_9SPHI|nr:hypothetical protein [Mucilaginibacter robiniae]QJD97215.1 hypothetical protein HH214_15730 [Mucilaginibacter robiniae]
MNKLITCYITVIVLLLLSSCHKARVVNTAFYYWKTVYVLNSTEKQYFNKLHSHKLYLRMMDVDNGDNGPVPVSPVTFKATFADSVQVIPVVFIVNDILKNQTQQQLDNLAAKIVYYVNGKMVQAGKTSFNELQIDCDWTRTTRDNYFFLLKRIKANTNFKNKQLSATLRLHQLKNQKSNGVPPVNRVMLMCYNMGNLRQYGSQNSILNQSELEKYVGDNLNNYQLPVDIGLPLFSWAVVFRQKQYAGIAKRLNQQSFTDSLTFKLTNNNLYILQKDLPELGLIHGDEIRWETIPADKLSEAAKYIEKHLASDTVNIIYFHLNEPTLKHYNYETLEKTAALFR